MDSVCIGLTSSSRVTFAKMLLRYDCHDHPVQPRAETNAVPTCPRHPGIPAVRANPMPDNLFADAPVHDRGRGMRNGFPPVQPGRSRIPSMTTVNGYSSRSSDDATELPSG